MHIFHNCISAKMSAFYVAENVIRVYLFELYLSLPFELEMSSGYVVKEIY